MDDLIELGIEGVDKVVDKHFDKVPDKALHKATYDPRNLRKSHRRKYRRETRDSSSSPSDREPPPYPDSPKQDPRMRPENPDPNLAYNDPYTEDRPSFITMHDNEYGRNGTYPGSVYSSEPPHPRSQYIPPPPPPPIGAPPREFVPAPGAPPSYFEPVDRRDRRGRSGYESDDEEYYSDFQRKPRRPRPGNRRRSSSYHGPRDGQLALATRQKGTAGTMVDNARDKAHRYGLKDEITDVFSSSKAGLAGGAVGAVVGGWAAQEAQVAMGKDGGGRKDKCATSAVLTLLGAAVGGLAVNALVDRYEDGKKEAKEKQEKWDEKWDDRSSGPPVRKNRRRRDNYDDDGSYSR